MADNNDAFKTIGGALMQAAAKQREKRVAEGDDVQDPDIVISQSPPIMTLKPEQQEILDDRILWTWKEPDNHDGDGWIVWANYFIKDREPWYAGQYIVKLQFGEPQDIIGEGTDIVIMDAGKTKDMAVALLSASRWEQSWQRYVGEYLAVSS